MESKPTYVTVCQRCGFAAPEHVVLIGYVMDAKCDVCGVIGEDRGIIKITESKGATDGKR